jgi:hypothetical protein
LTVAMLVSIEAGLITVTRGRGRPAGRVIRTRGGAVPGGVAGARSAAIIGRVQRAGCGAVTSGAGAGPVVGVVAPSWSWRTMIAAGASGRCGIGVLRIAEPNATSTPVAARIAKPRTGGCGSGVTTTGAAVVAVVAGVLVGSPWRTIAWARPGTASAFAVMTGAGAAAAGVAAVAITAAGLCAARNGPVMTGAAVAAAGAAGAAVGSPILVSAADRHGRNCTGVATSCVGTGPLGGALVGSPCQMIVFE